MIRGSIRRPKALAWAIDLKAHLLTHPVGREIFMDAEYIEGDVKAYSMLPYYAERIAGPALADCRRRRLLYGPAL